MKTIIKCIISIFLFSPSSPCTSSTAQPNVNVLEAITICREKLAEDPHFPKIQHSLAQLLDSQISIPVDTTLVSEVLRLYQSVGRPSSDVVESRLPPAKVRVESLVRAGAIAKDMLHDTRQAISLYLMAMSVDDIEDASLVAVFEMVMPLLLSSVQTVDIGDDVLGRDIGRTTTSSADLQNILSKNGDEPNLEVAFYLCNVVSSKCPNEPTVDEYRGATLRKMKRTDLAYQSYQNAMAKSKRQYLDCKEGTDQNVSECIVLMNKFINASILVAASGREAGIDFDEQLAYLVEAESLILCIKLSSDVDELIREAFRDQLVDLYNNMGIVEKKRGRTVEARQFFRRAVELNPKDGHALVQLASTEDNSNEDDILSNVKELDPGYVSALFDGYSSRFETELVEVLQYKGHILVYEAIQLQVKVASSLRRIVDLGCGTGLLGELVANEMPWVEVYGVDLSQRMADISRERKTVNGTSIYKTVYNGDAGAYLSTFDKQSVDCIGASDVFIYIGEISTVLEESFKCLVNGGILAFTVESYNDATSESGLRLLSAGRFGHSRRYIETTAKLKGFELLSWKESVLRQQSGKDVKGAVVVLKKI